MRIEEVFQDDGKALEESFAIAKIRKEALERSKSGKRPNITVLQGSENKTHYIIFVSEKGNTYKTEMVSGNFKRTQKTTINKAASEINKLKLKGWESIDTRGWVEKYKTGILMGSVGLITGIGLTATGLAPITVVLMPIISTFFGVFSSLFSEAIKNPLRFAGMN